MQGSSKKFAMVVQPLCLDAYTNTHQMKKIAERKINSILLGVQLVVNSVRLVGRMCERANIEF